MREFARKCIFMPPDSNIIIIKEYVGLLPDWYHTFDLFRYVLHGTRRIIQGYHYLLFLPLRMLTSLPVRHLMVHRKSSKKKIFSVCLQSAVSDAIQPITLISLHTTGAGTYHRSFRFFSSAAPVFDRTLRIFPTAYSFYSASSRFHHRNILNFYSSKALNHKYFFH